MTIDYFPLRFKTILNKIILNSQYNKTGDQLEHSRSRNKFFRRFACRSFKAKREKQYQMCRGPTSSRLLS